MNTRMSALRSVLLVGALAVAGCSLPMEVPAKFIVLDRGAHEIQAMSPDQARLSVLDLGDAKEGDLSFWSEALRNDFQGNRGYVLVEERKVKDAAGRDGAESIWETTLDGVAQRYLVTVFIVGDTVRTVEYLAPKPVFEKYLEDVRKAVGTLR
jgi:hypothetical protein